MNRKTSWLFFLGACTDSKQDTLRHCENVSFSLVGMHRFDLHSQKFAVQNEGHSSDGWPNWQAFRSSAVVIILVLCDPSNIVRHSVTRDRVQLHTSTIDTDVHSNTRTSAARKKARYSALTRHSVILIVYLIRVYIIFFRWSCLGARARIALMVAMAWLVECIFDCCIRHCCACAHRQPFNSYI